MVRRALGRPVPTNRGAQASLPFSLPNVLSRGSLRSTLFDATRIGNSVMDSPCRVLDTDSMPWEAHVRPRANELRKVLHVDPDTNGYLHLRYVPPSVSTRSTRIFHRTVRELGFWISGDLRSWNYASPHDQNPVCYPSRRYVFMDRPPRSVHGAEPGRRSFVGTQLLLWSTHGGEFEMDPAETVTIGERDEFSDISFTMPGMIQTATLPWCRHPAVPEWMIKEVAPADYGVPLRIVPVNLVFVPANWQSEGFFVQSREQRCWLFLLAGSLQVTLPEQGITSLREGAYVDWRRPARIALHGAGGPEGAVVLCVGHDLSSKQAR